MEKARKQKCFFYKWRIENFDFCGQKTGEYLESPLFSIESSPQTSWRLRLYPRGEEDGEYISSYLVRATNGPEFMDVDFELSVYVEERLLKPPVSFEKIYSFRNFQLEGDKTFLLRREIFLRNPAWPERCTLTIGCRIFKRNGDGFEVIEKFGRTLIAKERIYGMARIDNVSDLDPEKNKDIEVKTLLEYFPLIAINLSCSNEIITIKIHPKRCEEVKYAICKIIVITNGDKESRIEHVRTWVGQIVSDVERHGEIFPQDEADEQDVARNARKTFFLKYEFSYSTGVEYANNEINDYGTYLWIDNISLSESSFENFKDEKPTSYVSATDALKREYETMNYSDVIINTKTKIFKAHKAILRNRSSLLAEMLKDNPESIELGIHKDDIIQKFLLFLYTDSVEDMYYQAAIELYQMASEYKVEFLKKKCRSILEKKCHTKNVGDILLLANTSEDSCLKEYIKKYIIAHDEEVFSTEEWQFFAERYWEVAEKYMLMKYQKKDP